MAVLLEETNWNGWPSANEASISIHQVTILPSLTVSNDQLSLATTNGHQTVHSFDAGLHGLPHRDAGDDARGLQTHTPTLLIAQGPFGVETETDWSTQVWQLLDKEVQKS